MKARISRQDAHKLTPKPLAISFAEIVLMVGYLMVAWMMPTGWLDTAFGAMAFAVAGMINPYLSEYSIAFAADPQYFIHCHVLAAWLFPILLPVLIIRRNHGRYSYCFYWKARNKQFGGWLIHLISSVLFYGLLYFSMVWLVDYPLKRGEWAIWVGCVAPSALMLLGVLGIGVLHAYMIIFSAFSDRGCDNELQQKREQ